MRRLFWMECRKIARSAVYWLYAAALAVTVLQNYETVVESELGRTDDPASVFYIAENGVYADMVDGTTENEVGTGTPGATTENGVGMGTPGAATKSGVEADTPGATAENGVGTGTPGAAAENGGYADIADGLSEAVQRSMMTGATKRLLDNYRSNLYEYYPFGYVKEKRLSEKKQAAILLYLTELTGLDELSVIGVEENLTPEEIQISGGGAFVLSPGQGGTYENGQFTVDPGAWEYVENPSGLADTAENVDNPSGLAESPEYPETKWEIQVTFERFLEIMDAVSGLIGRNSYFSRTMLSLYYCENDMQDAPITLRQHLEFYEKDRVTGAFARYYCDCISLIVLGMPALIVIDLWLKDKRYKMISLIYPRRAASAKLIFPRLWAVVSMSMLPVLILPLRSLAALLRYCREAGAAADLSAFAVYAFAWIFPTILLAVSMALAVTALTENYSAVLAAGLLWLFGRPGIDKLAGGNYGLFDPVIRHNTLKGYGRMMANIRALALNRAFVSVAALLFAVSAILICNAKRKGGMSLESRKSADAGRRQYPHER